ncbi:adenosylmethionine decarboxylase [Erysipelothrix sp. HDW6B]|uniref:adenosylmethionine decarboxylase n=1 Tax=Erysipelothrix sp. HDW6B TaxID=2714929 RepID=UPI001409EB81|nr:adenosylmethionine decarboxylase [Erysipelothrix sp. HDW6B]QIK85805.1 adenosylmethionine decarboxylase [Erysipelothrix sp. HDW6B]
MKDLKIIQKHIGLDTMYQIEIGMVTLYLNKTIATKELARIMKVPTPLATALKKELVKAGYLKRESFYMLTPMGIDYVESDLGYRGINKEFYMQLIKDETARLKYIQSQLDALNLYYETRPDADVTLDQAHATLQTVIARVSRYILDPLIFKKQIVFLGDDDLVSILLAQVLKSLGLKQTQITVYDIDQRVLNHIQKADRSIRCIQADFRQSLNTNIIADLIFMDPPYTVAGVASFLEFAQNLISETGTVYLSFSDKQRAHQHELQKHITATGWYYSEIIENFNKYQGGGIIGNQSNLYILERATASSFETSMYTYDSKRKGQTQVLGYHSLYELRDSNASLLKNIAYVKEAMYRIVDTFKLTAVTDEFHQFDPYGVSGAIILSESHFTIHTWPEHGYAALDLFVCHEDIHEYEILQQLKVLFESRQATVRKLERSY